MHLPTSELGSVIKAGSCFNSTIVPAAGSVLQSPSSYSSSCNRSFSIPIAFLVLLERVLGLLSPPSLRSSIPARVTYFSRFRLVKLLPPSSLPAECIQISIFIATFFREFGYKRFISLAPVRSNSFR
ncbi:hypothetical protein TNCV_1227791 [Trichonephila clavipes]|nr:hypothetical protein TNCV_1227791 [Trichonephila clavipes]